jgi:hypothetical protein
VLPVVTVTAPAPLKVTGPAVIPFSVPAKVIAAVIVFALVRTMFGIVPIEGPPRTTAE